MKISTEIYEMLYVSTIAPAACVSVVSTIAMKSRVSNALRSITGMLVFDGIRFCQYLEGGKDELAILFERISKDSRHAAVTMIHHGPLQNRRFKKFSLAFATGDDFEALSRLEGLKGPCGVTAFSELLQTLDKEAQCC